MKRTSHADLHALTLASREAPRCAATTKKRFATEADARQELERVAAKRERGNARRREQRTYPCIACGGWHLTALEGSG